MAAFEAEVAAWVRTLELSVDIKIPKRDLANGCVVAEILARYFPDLVPLHSFENVSSLPLKDANWHLLLKLFRRIGLAVDERMANRVMLCEEGAAVELMQRIWRHLAASDSAVAVAPNAAVAAHSTAGSAPSQPGLSQAQLLRDGLQLPAEDTQQPWLGVVPLQPEAQLQLMYASGAAVPGWQQPVAGFAVPHNADAGWQPQQQVQQQQQVQPPASQLEQLSQGMQRGYSHDAAAAQWQDGSAVQEWQQAMQQACEPQQWQALQHPQQWAAFSAAESALQPPSWQQAQQPVHELPAAQHQRRMTTSRKVSGTSRTAALRKAAAQDGKHVPHAAGPWQRQAQQPAPEQSCVQQSASQQQHYAQSIAQADLFQQAMSQQAALWQQQAMQHYWLQQQQLQDQQVQEQQMALQQQQLYQQQMQQNQQQHLPPGLDERSSRHQPDPQQHTYGGMSGGIDMMQQSEGQVTATQLPTQPMPAVCPMTPHNAAHIPSAWVPDVSGAVRAGFWDDADMSAPYTAGGNPAIQPGQNQQSSLAQQSSGQVESKTDADVADEPSNSRIPTLAFDRKPRPVDFRPFTQEEFRQKNYDAKHMPKYWELGLLGPVPDEQLETKLQARQRVQEFGRRTAKQNHERQEAIAAQQAGKKSAQRPLTARERAMSFAKCIQRPASTARLTQSAQGRLTCNAGGAPDMVASGAAAAANNSSSWLSKAQQQRDDELARLQRQHEADQQSVAAIAQDLRMHGTQPVGQ